MLAIGQRFDRYTIEALLGRGGMGEVYRAFDPRLERRVALKVLHAAPAVVGAVGTKESAGHAARLIREARAAAALDHPNVVAIFDIGEVEDTTFLAMELIDGRTLRSFLGEDIAIATRLGWLLDIATTLAYAHDRGLVHRDIKPENIMVRADGVLKVLDFGIARRARALPTAATMPADGSPATTGTGASNSTFAGTPRYMAPEQMSGQALDGRADQFAWGVVAYELLSGGTMPWPHANDLVSLIAAVIGTDPVPLAATGGSGHFVGVSRVHPPTTSAVMRAARFRMAGMKYLGAGSDKPRSPPSAGVTTRRMRGTRVHAPSRNAHRRPRVTNCRPGHEP